MTQTASFALFTRNGENGVEYLAQWNSRWQRYNFVGGKQEQQETPRECVLREVEEELQLDFESDFHVSESAICKLRFTEISERTGKATDYHFAMFQAHFTGQEVAGTISDRSENRWLTVTEIVSQATDDGRAISRVMTMTIRKLGEFQP